MAVLIDFGAGFVQNVLVPEFFLAQLAEVSVVPSALDGIDDWNRTAY